jgi:hypothetical protein
MAVDYAGPRAAPEQSAAAFEAGAEAFVRNYDWILFGAVAALVGYGLHLVAGINAMTSAGSPDYYVVRQADLRRRRQHRDVRRVASSTPMSSAATGASSTRCRCCLLLLVIPLGTEATRLAAVARRRRLTFQPSELGKLLVVLAVAGFLAERARRVGEVGTVLGAIGLDGDPDRARVHAAGHRDVARLRRRARRDAVRCGTPLASRRRARHDDRRRSRARRLAAAVARRRRARAVPA